jgi:hypothetical protein
MVISGRQMPRADPLSCAFDSQAKGSAAVAGLLLTKNEF